MSALVVLSSLGLASCLAMFIAPIQTLVKIYKADAPPASSQLFPFVATLVNCLLWFSYGVAIQNVTLILSNLVGFVVAAVACMLFMHKAAADDRVPQAKKVAAGLFVGLVLLGVGLAMPTYQRVIEVLGGVAMGGSILMYGAPLSVLYAVIVKGEDASSLTFIPTLMSFSNATIWLFYGLLLRDVHVWSPNVVGIIVGFVQLLTVVFFYIRAQGQLAKAVDAPVKGVDVSGASSPTAMLPKEENFPSKSVEDLIEEPVVITIEPDHTAVAI
jgi:solute carrier family 50 protein (sugar transporter)